MTLESIYTDRSNAKLDIQCYGVESRKCEEFLSMGYQFSNGVNIAKRMKYLDDEITRLEDLQKKSGRRR